jgi:23S rRNA G2445 N2-methylase RlmL
MKNFFVSCPRGLEELLLEESSRFNFQHTELTRGGITFKTSHLKALNLMLESRIASRVYKEIGSFQFSSDKDMHKAAMEIPWTKIMNPDDTFKITTTLSREVNRIFKNSHFLSLLLKDAIVDVFKDKSGSRPSIDLDDPTYPFVLRVENDPINKCFKGIVSVDLSGYPLHQRGYRQIGHNAPIKENLAAALIIQSGWDKKSPLYDPFCGSGTFLIEGALYRHNIAPTILKLKQYQHRDQVFAFEKQKWFQKDVEIHQPYRNLVNELLAHSKNAMFNFDVAEFNGNDITRKAIGLLIEGWAALELPRKALRFTQKSALEYLPNDNHENGVIITNPPYGVRLEEKNEELEQLYHEFGESLKNNWKGFRAFIVSQDSSLRKKISLKTTSRFTFYNGSLECRLLNYDLF